MLSFRYPRPGPRSRPWPDLKYFLYGFVYIQDMLEHAMIRVQAKGGNTPVGIVTQQFPYPCWLEDK